MEIRQARKSSVSIMPVFFCGGSGTKTQGGGGGASPGPGRQGTDGRRGGGGVWFRGQEGERNRGGVDVNTHPGKRPQEGGRQSREMQKSVHRMENGEERGWRAPSRFPRKTTESRVRGRSSGRSPMRARWGQQERTSPMAHRKGGQGDPDRQRREKGETRVICCPRGHP